MYYYLNIHVTPTSELRSRPKVTSSLKPFPTLQGLPFLLLCFLAHSSAFRAVSGRAHLCCEGPVLDDSEPLALGMVLTLNRYTKGVCKIKAAFQKQGFGLLKDRFSYL